MPDDDFEALLRDTLAERSARAPESLPVEQRTLAAVRRGPVRRPRPVWLVPAAVACSVLAVIGATVGGVALARNLSGPDHSVAASATTTPAPSATVSSTRPTTSTPAATSSPTTASAPTTSIQVGPVGGPVPAKFRAADLTWVSSNEGWALGTAPCKTTYCTSLLRTTDGGRTWVGLQPPVVGLTGVDNCASGACVTHVRFATPLVGYLFGPQRLFLTTDGGARWQRLSGGALALEIADSNVLRVTTSLAGCIAPGCNYVVQMAGIGGQSWHQVLAPTSPGMSDGVELARVGTHAYVQVDGHPAGGAGQAHSALYSSTNGGVTWTNRNEPCPQGSATGEVDARALTAAAGNGAAVVLCTPRVAGNTSFVATSGPSGTGFHAGTATAGITAPIGAASATVLFVVGEPGTSRAGELLRSTDGGQHWAKVASAPAQGTALGAGFLGFESAETGRWVSAQDPGTVFTTTDGGASWTADTIH